MNLTDNRQTWILRGSCDCGDTIQAKASGADPAEVLSALSDAFFKAHDGHHIRTQMSLTEGRPK